jgi:hypothetical protein
MRGTGVARGRQKGTRSVPNEGIWRCARYPRVSQCTSSDDYQLCRFLRAGRMVHELYGKHHGRRLPAFA